MRLKTEQDQGQVISDFVPQIDIGGWIEGKGATATTTGRKLFQYQERKEKRWRPEPGRGRVNWRTFRKWNFMNLGNVWVSEMRERKREESGVPHRSPTEVMGWMMMLTEGNEGKMKVMHIRGEEAWKATICSHSQISQEYSLVRNHGLGLWWYMPFSHHPKVKHHLFSQLLF